MKRKILWLPSWYPNKHEPLNGDFIERHAKAASLLYDVTVIYVVKDRGNLTSRNTTILKQQYQDYPSLTAVVCYYKSRLTFLSSFFSLLKYFQLQKKLIDEYIHHNGKPDVINVHISFKAGLGALYAKWKYNIPFTVSEQWTIFCPEAKPAFSDQAPIVKMFIRNIYKNAWRTSAVSNYLAQSLSNSFQIEKPVRIPNVVDTSLFYPSPVKHDVFTFIHISVLNYQKSPDQIIEAVELLKQRIDRPFRLIIYGPFVPSLDEKIKKHNLHEAVDYRQEVMQDQLSDEVRRCHSLILYSRFETFGCVVIEALAAGLPVIVSDIPVMRELVSENENGIFARLNDSENLAEKMLWMMKNYAKFDLSKISREAKENYSFTNVAKQFNDLYALL